MLKRITVAGLIAGVIVGGQLFAVALLGEGKIGGGWGELLGYATMLLAFSLVFLAVKQQRDVDGGGVIRFVPAFAMGLAISAFASVIYVLSWEAAMAVGHMDFAAFYARSVIEAQKDKGVSGPELDKLVRDMEAFKAQYAKPWIRFGMGFMEIFPVGFIVSLVSAVLLRNSRFMPARRT